MMEKISHLISVIHGYITNYPEVQWHKIATMLGHGICGSGVWAIRSGDGLTSVPGCLFTEKTKMRCVLMAGNWIHLNCLHSHV